MNTATGSMRFDAAAGLTLSVMQRSKKLDSGTLSVEIETESRSITIFHQNEITFGVDSDKKEAKNGSES
eukprot:651806-Amorphochlora_amoeboformis.AAC.2